VIDANSGATLHAHAADERRYPASLTKMMTVYLIFEALKRRRLRANDRIRFSENAANQQPSKLGLQPGETITVDQAIRALITKSANDVATAVAERIAGNEPAFARLMTRKARALGMSNTVFRNASGLPDAEQTTTARDMAVLGLVLQDHFPRGYRMFSLQRFAFRNRRYTNHNRLLGRFRGTDGIKTGYTRASGFNITTSVRRDGKHLIGVVIGQRSGRKRNAVMRRLLTRTLPRASTRPTRKIHRLRTNPMLVARPRVVHHARAGHRAPALRRPQPRHRPNARSGPLRLTQRPAIAQRPLTWVATTRARERSTHHVQVGAFHSDTEARQALDIAQARAGGLLRNYQPLSLKAQSNERTVYRARFAGFDRPRATATCAKLKSVSVDCFVTPSN